MFNKIRGTFDKILCKISKKRRDRKKQIDDEAEKLFNSIFNPDMDIPNSDIKDIYEFKSPKQ